MLKLCILICFLKDVTHQRSSSTGVVLLCQISLCGSHPRRLIDISLARPFVFFSSSLVPIVSFLLVHQAKRPHANKCCPPPKIYSLTSTWMAKKQLRANAGLLPVSYFFLLFEFTFICRRPTLSFRLLKMLRMNPKVLLLFFPNFTHNVL